MSNFNIKTIDYKNVNAPKDFVESLRNTGFAVLHNHGLDDNLINSVYSEWSSFFNSKKKYNYLFDLEKQDGYFPMKSENAKDYNTKDLKEFFHIYLPWGRIPEEISENTIKIRNKLVDIGTELLKWINDNTPDNISQNFSMPLNDMIKDSQNNLLRVLHYPPIRDDDNKDALRAAPHGDINMITILLAGSEPGLQVLDMNKKWVDVGSNKGWLIINSGDMLNKCSKGYYPSTIHRVVNPDINNNKSRYSMPLFLHARDEVILTEEFTAKQYLEKRLKSLGLK